MKWVLIAFILCLATLIDGSALRSTPDSEYWTDDTRKDLTQPSNTVRRVNKTSDIQCLAGSEWDSNCHKCRCTDTGRAECVRQDNCSGTYGEPTACKARTSFKRDCNTCHCLETGLALCSLKGCVRTKPPVSSVLRSGKECLPGSRWKSKCNGCICLDDGHPTCSEEACPEHEDEPDMVCDPGTTWKNECNTCSCSPLGRPMCTRMGCEILHTFDFNPKGNDEGKKDTELDNELDDHNIVRRSAVCKPNALLKADCNFCKCSSDGQSYSCTLNECLEHDINDDVEVFKESEEEDDVGNKVCKPRGTFYIGCNTCHCSVDGTNFTCTNKPCPLPDDVEIFHELLVLRSSPDTKLVVCTANRMFIKDCNTCWCNEDGTSYFCTRKVCIAEVPEDLIEDKPENLQEIKRKCRPDEVFELDCNTCRCAQDGMSFSCTRRACVPEEQGKNVSLNRRIRSASQATPKACQPGQEFRLDCNKCLCNNEGQDFSCTRIDCAALNSNGNAGVRAKREIATQVMTECEPGSVFRQGCSLCRCTTDGNHATCALKRCKEPSDDSTDKDLPESDPSFRCKPGDQFKQGCNYCTCSADGKGFFCTILLCD